MHLTPRSRRRASINITSLIDVLFLLLIFFMVSSTFEQNPGMLLDLPAAETSTPTEQRDIVLSVDPDGTVFLNDRVVQEEDLPDRLKQELAALGDPSLILQADTKVQHGVVVRLMDLAKQLGIERLVIATKEK